MQTVFLVDDDDNYRELVQLTLEDDCDVDNVRGFARGGDLLRHLEQHPEEVPGLVLIDLHMPEMSGLELLQRLRQRHAGVPVALLSGGVAPEERQACLAAGAIAFLPKPLAYADLVPLLQGLVRSVGAPHA